MFGITRDFALILAAIIIMIVALLWKRSKDHHSKIELDDLLLGDDGKISKAAAVMFGSFVLTTWMMVYLCLDGKVTEGYFAAYGAMWVAPTVARIIKGRDQPST